jgi:stage II sporulation protein M
VKYFFLLLCFVTGIAAGALFVNALPAEKSDELMRVISGFCTGISDGEVRAPETFRASLSNNLRSAAILYLCAMSVYLLPVIYLHMTAKGFVIGFTVGFMSLFFAGKGFLFVLVSVLPQSIVLLPATMLLSVLALNFSLKKIRASKNAFLKGDKRRELLKFTYMTLGVCAVMLVSALIDAFVIPVFVKSVSGLF